MEDGTVSSSARLPAAEGPRVQFGVERRWRYVSALAGGLMLHASVLWWGRLTPPAATVPGPAPVAALQIELEPERAATGRGGTPGPSHASGEERAAPVGKVAPKLAPLNRIVEPAAQRPVVGNTDDETAESPELTSPDLFALDAELSAAGESAPVSALKLAPVRTRVLRVPPNQLSSGAAELGQAGDRASSDHARGDGLAGRGGGAGNGSEGRLVKQDFAFGGSTGPFLGQVCFIPPGTHSVASVGACVVEVEFRTQTIDVSPRRFVEGFPGVTQRTEWFAVLYTGSFRTANSGRHHFRVVSDDGAYLVLDGRRVIDNDGQHGPASRGVTIRLDAGSHDFELHYFQGPREMLAIQLFVTAPGGEEQLLRDEI
jgi:PA14 domain